MALVYLFSAIALEIAGTLCLKLSNGFARPLPSGLAFLFYGLMNIPLILALKTLPLSLTYAVWAGTGVVAASLLGVLVFGETLTPQRVAFIAITLVGIVGLHIEIAR